MGGAGVDVKIGPKLNGELGFGTLVDFSERFDTDAYAKGQLTLSAGLKAETYYYHLNLAKPSDRGKIKLPFETETFMELKKINLFPEFHTKAVFSKAPPVVVQTSDADDAVGVSSYSDTNIGYPLPISHEIADKETDKTIVESETIETFESEQDGYQNISGQILIPSELGTIEPDDIVVRPVFNYRGYKVKTQPTDVLSDILLTPCIANLCAGGTHFISGMTPVSQVTLDSITYIEGNLLGHIKGDARFEKKRTFSTVDFLDLSSLDKSSGSTTGTHPLFGVWTGIISTQPVSFTFTDDSTGIYNGIEFTYMYNTPLKGGITIMLENDGVISFSILKIEETEMKIVMKGTDTVTVLQKECLQ